jgi:hypothetical protein
VAELATATGEGLAYGFDSSTSYVLKGKVVVAGGGQWPGESVEVLTYDVATNAYDTSFPDLNNARRNHAGFFVPGNPGRMWVFGGRQAVDTPPYQPPEYFDVPVVQMPNTMHVGAMQLTKAGTGPWVLTGKGKIHDGSHAVLPGVVVQAQWLLPSGSKMYRQFTTGAQGGYQFNLSTPTAGQYRFCVVGLVKVGYTYVKADNHPNPPCRVINTP